MSYIDKETKGKQNAEALFPLRKRIGLCLFALLPAFSPLAQTQLIQEAKNRLATYAEQQNWPKYKVEVQPWIAGGEKHLPKCDSQVRYLPSSPQKAPLGRVSYQIRCDQPSWNLRARADVKVWLVVWSAKTDIQPNHLLTPLDLVAREVEVSRLHRGFTPNIEDLVGKLTKRRIRAARLVSPSQLKPPYLVREGDEVVIRAGSKTFKASMKGKALQNGAMGERIKVQNLSSGKRIQAWVIGAGEVETKY